jgi:hypothetical protein
MCVCVCVCLFVCLFFCIYLSLSLLLLSLLFVLFNAGWGWLNTNATIRNAATVHANQLNQVLRDIVSNTTFSTFEMVYYDFPMEEMFTHWVSTYDRPVLELFEPFLGMLTDILLVLCSVVVYLCLCLCATV